MAFQSVPNCAIVEVVGTLDDQVVENTFYGRFASAYAQSDIDALATAVDGWVNDFWRAALGANYIYTNTKVRGLTSAIDMAAEDSTSSGPGGISTGSPIPNNVTLSVKRRSALTGRGARGRVFVPGWRSTMLSTDNVANAAVAGVMEDALNEMRGAMAAVDWEEVIVHRVAAGTPLVPAVAFTVIEYVVVNLVMDSMRRRLPGRGN